MQIGAYYQLFNLLSEYIYGSAAVLDEFQQLTMTQLCTILSLFSAVLPFLVVGIIVFLVCRFVASFFC